jgi:outer membrane protein OmpA-like peptidoglycan-associated protein
MKQFLTVLFAVTTLGAFAQSSQVWLEKADEYFRKTDYANALVHYQLAINDSLALTTQVRPYEVEISNKKLKNSRGGDSTRIVPVIDYVHHQIALSYLLMKDYSHALEHFQQTTASGSFPEDRYYLGVAQMNAEQYRNAIQTFETYVSAPGGNDSLTKMALQLMTGSHYALDSMNVRTKIVVAKADSTLNSGTASFAPMLFANDTRLLFTSARPGGVVVDPEKQQSEYLCDLYWTERTGTGNGWTAATNFGRPLNTAQHDASGSFTNNNVLFYTRWSDEKRTDQSIYLGRMIDFLFFESYRLDSSINVPGYKSINPFVSLDGKTLFFSSNRPGGKGGMDIWKIAIDELGNPSGTAVNLGEPVNSEADELTPFFHEASSTLFFSSNGHYTIGGLDNFKSAYDRDNDSYAIPENMDMPINSSKDDSYLVWDLYMNKGYFASDREDCPTNHCYDIYEITNAPIRITLDGYVYDAQTEEILPDATVTFKDVRASFPSFTATTDEKGYYFTEIQQYWEVFAKAQKPKYFADGNYIDARKITEDTHLTQDFYLARIPLGEITIEGIEYDFDSDKLRPEAHTVLDKLAEFLELNDNLVVEINSHTDSRGPDIYNLDLSQRRAKSCVNYLIAKGISMDRLIPIGYGETQPAILLDANKQEVTGTDGQPVRLTEAYIESQPTKDKQEELHQRNRRTTFKVIGEAFVTP